MGGLFGGSGQTLATSETPLTGFNVQSSVFGKPVPLIYGRNRVAANLLWYGDFKAIPHTTSSSASGGKGGGSITTTNTTYTYETSVQLGLGEGPVYAVNAYWKDKDYYSNADVFTKFLGGYSQSAWSYLATNHPTEALNYRGHAYVAAASYDLGNSSGLGNHSFDVTGLLPFNAGTINGADPKALITDFLTNAHYGAGFDSGYMDSWVEYSSYCIANNIFISPVYDTQEEARKTVADLVELTNSGIFFSEGKLKIVPFSDTLATANGVTYTPNVVPAYDLDDDDFQDQDRPIRVLRTPNADAYNQVQLEFKDAANSYNTAIATAQDQASIEVYGLKARAVITAHCITDATTARLVAQLILQRGLYTRNTYEFELTWKYARLEPCDYVTVTDVRLELDHVPVRVLSVEEDDEGMLRIQAEDAPAGVLHSPLYEAPGSSGYVVNFNVDPGDIVAPKFFEVPAWKSVSGLQIGIAVTGNSDDWGGCEVWASNDGTSYAFVGQVIGGARYGTITNTITSADEQVARASLVGNGGQILSGSVADATNLSTLAIVDNEFVAYTTATLISANVYDLTLSERAVYSTVAAAHSAGAPFVRVDDAVAYSDPLDLAMIGKTLHFKFLSFNKYGGAKKQLADVTAYTYEILGVMAKLAPPSISGFSAIASANSIMLDWTNPDPTGTSILRTEVWRNTINDSASAELLGSVVGPVGFYADYLGSGGLTRYYWLRAINKQQFPSAFSSVASATTGTISAEPADGSVTHAKLAVDAVWAGNIKAGEIQAGHLAANSVVAGNIAANAITAAGGQIADLSVGTLKIQDNAVVVPVHAMTVENTYTYTTSTASAGSMTIISAAITLDIATDVIVIFTPMQTALLSGTSTKTIALYRTSWTADSDVGGSNHVVELWARVNGSTTYGAKVFGVTGPAASRLAGGGEVEAFTVKLSLPAGTHTISIDFVWSGMVVITNTFTLTNRSRSLILIGAKK